MILEILRLGKGRSLTLNDEEVQSQVYKLRMKLKVRSSNYWFCDIFFGPELITEVEHRP